MLKIEIPAFDCYDEETETFTSIKSSILFLEHSLLSLSKWESIWHKPFFSDAPKTQIESIDYVRCMTINKDVNPLIYTRLTPEHFKRINSYMDDPMTATWFNDNSKNKKTPSKEIITAEVIYWQMIQYHIPIEFQKWHLNKLITLIRVCALKSEPPKKMSKKDLYNRNRALNAARKAKLNTRG